MAGLSELYQLVARVVTSMRRAPTFGTVSGVAGGAAQLGTEHPDEAVPALFLQQYGFASAPPDGSPAGAVYVGGQTYGALIVATGHATFSVPLEAGEVALYHPSGAIVHLTKDGDVVLSPAAARHVLLGGPAASHPAVLGDLLRTLYNSMTVPSPFGPLGPPLQPMTEVQLSTPVKVA
jgi:hypothetical protein